MFGGQSRNVISSGEGNDQLYGREGGDTLRGGGGNDVLDGGVHRDVLTGGEGADTFYFASAAEAGDTITDFSSGDHIALSAAGFELESVDDFAFALTSDPLMETPTAIYNATSGNLSWDSDGSGDIAAVYFATLSGAPALSQNDFLVV
jgi:Ca2+-binding RTX toxin-like protein